VCFGKEQGHTSCEVYGKPCMARQWPNALSTAAVCIAKFVAHCTEAVYDARTAAKNLFENLFLVLLRGDPQFCLDLFIKVRHFDSVRIIRNVAVIKDVFE